MILFLVGLLVGIGMAVFVICLSSAESEEDGGRTELCRKCPYQPFDDGRHDCAACHDATE